MKEKILEAFKALGFEMEDMEGLGYGFQYEGRHYLYMYNEDDEDFLNISIPAVMDLDDENNVGFYQVMDKINGTLKYVKANKLNDSMWLFYERELLGRRPDAGYLPYDTPSGSWLHVPSQSDGQY